MITWGSARLPDTRLPDNSFARQRFPDNTFARQHDCPTHFPDFSRQYVSNFKAYREICTLVHAGTQCAFLFIDALAVSTSFFASSGAWLYSLVVLSLCFPSTRIVDAYPLHFKLFRFSQHQ